MLIVMQFSFKPNYTILDIILSVLLIYRWQLTTYTFEQRVEVTHFAHRVIGKIDYFLRERTELLR